MPTHLIQPHGGKLVQPLADARRCAEIHAASRDWPSWTLTVRQLCDLELLLNGGFSPLTGFMGRRDYDSVCATMRLASGILWPMPIVLDVPEGFARELNRGSTVALRDPEGVMLAALHVEEVWEPDWTAEARVVYGTTSRNHPGVAYLLDRTHRIYVGGRVEGLQLPTHYDFRSLRLTPAELRAEFVQLGWWKIVAFNTRNPMHRAHYELTLRAIREVGANLLIHPVVGMTKPGDLDHYTRVRCYQAVLRHYPTGTVKLALLPLAMRMAGPREVLWHAIIRKNYGCTHLIVGRDHAGPGADSNGASFYEPYAAQELMRRYEGELGVRMLPFKVMVYVEELDAYVPEDAAAGRRALNISGTELRRLLMEGREIPSWFTFSEVAEELRRTHPPRQKQGFTVFLTGLSGSGKSTIAAVLLVRLLEIGGRPVTLLDGDVIRKNLWPELGFSKEDREINILRVGFVAAEVTKNRGVAICAAIAPYDSVRRRVREMIHPLGGFVLVHVATPLEVCETRDRKGIYAKARAGLIENFTGMSDPYEEPQDAEMVIDTSELTPEEAARQIILYLERQGFIDPDPNAPSRHPAARSSERAPIRRPCTR